MMDSRLKELEEGVAWQESCIDTPYNSKFGNAFNIHSSNEIPQLAWLVERSQTGYDCTIGRSVERLQNGFFEGVWNGDFLNPSSVFGSETYGSGVLLFEQSPVFIQRKDVREFTFVLRDSENSKDYISNSLCFVLARAGIDKDSELHKELSKTLVESSFEQYANGFHRANPKVAKTERYSFYRLAYSDFWFEPNGKITFSRNITINDFKNWQEYKNYLLDTTARIFRNAIHPKRKQKLTPISTISQGYDSTAVSAIAKLCGCARTMTLAVRGDNGKFVARALGMKPIVFEHMLGESRKDGLKRELSNDVRSQAFEFIATAGFGDDVVFQSFEKELSGKMLMTGVGGDGNWALKANKTLGLPKGIPQNAGLTEFRLRVGFAHYPPILAGSVDIQSIIDISNSDEMKHYRIGGEYDRPIPRRLLEELDVPRESFGMKKKAQNPFFTNGSDSWSEAITETMKRYRVA